MKHVFILLSILFASCTTSSAQELGIRLGDVLGYDAAIDGVFILGEYNRLHANVSFGDKVRVEVLYDFLYSLLGDHLVSFGTLG